MSEKLKLSENHKRVVSVLLRGIEATCDEVEATLDETTGVMRMVSDDLSTEQGKTLRRMSEAVRSEIRRITSEIELDLATNSRRRRIRALVSSAIINLEESDPKKLRGYGFLAEEAVKHLENEFAKLLTMLDEMAEVVERT
ncbi:MAG TPA: hypothetical protein VGR81_12460 [Candidatus Acidoferrales bacterium]|nr:hypothetical protein [Candidatus Acidoferrales bacterium]